MSRSAASGLLAPFALGLASFALGLAVVLALGCGDEGKAPPADEAPGQAQRRFDPRDAPVAQLSEEEGAQSLPVLREALTNPELESSVRIWVARQIGQIPGDEATRTLGDALDSDDPEVAHAAIDALAARSGPVAREQLEAAADHSDPYISEAAKKALAAG